MSANMRGKLGGLFIMAESLGRFLGPAGYAVAYAWSVSPSAHQVFGGWVDYRFVFYASAVIIALAGKLAWGSLTAENLMKPEREDGVSPDMAGDDGNVGGSMNDATRTPSSSWATRDDVQRELV